MKITVILFEFSGSLSVQSTINTVHPYEGDPSLDGAVSESISNALAARS